MIIADGTNPLPPLVVVEGVDVVMGKVVVVVVAIKSMNISPGF